MQHPFENLYTDVPRHFGAVRLGLISSLSQKSFIPRPPATPKYHPFAPLTLSSTATGTAFLYLSSQVTFVMHTSSTAGRTASFWPDTSSEHRLVQQLGESKHFSILAMVHWPSYKAADITSVAGAIPVTAACCFWSCSLFPWSFFLSESGTYTRLLFHLFLLELDGMENGFRVPHHLSHQQCTFQALHASCPLHFIKSFR